ncbi:MAG: hypothetical protein QOK23_114 [Gammaproteobacteria bacterium]|nr:hypothetical protein [Gammaproteobacteria bacterium]
MAAIEVVEFKPRAQARSWHFAVAVSMAGIAGIVHDSWPHSAHESWAHAPVNLHAVYGVLLSAMVIAKFRMRVRSGLQEADIRPFSRQLVRAVFLLLYVLFAASQLIALGVFWWNRGALGALHPAVQLPPENLRDFLAYGVCALLTIHGLAELQRRLLRR